MKKSKNSKRVLIVEDDLFLVEMYVTKLEEAGYEVEIAEEGKEALRKIKEARPDLILLDIVLPGMDGFELLEYLKVNVRLKDIPVILLTNLGQRKDVERGISLGADAYIIKARFTPTEVVSKVKELVDKLGKKGK